ncbi:MAG: M20/M25/M40 family metallo-hydrolase, partial [Clostridiales bacterium]|nr:M20/M25/M40 family metallo-hydrolase [Clostridiales bacterium]
MIVLCIILAIIVVFIASLFINTVIQTSKARKLTDDKSVVSDDEINYYTARLQEMIKCKTVSVKNSYDDTEFAKLRNVMENLFPVVHKMAEKHIFSDDCWIYKINGKDTSRNIMLMSHHDVVAADGEWEHEPFLAEIADGKIWGRGTVDTKTPLFAEFSALEELLSNGFEPPCNIFIGSSHNEELGGDGIPTALEYFKEKGIIFEVILDEGGAVIDPPLGGMKCSKCAMVAVHEKGRYKLNCTATAENAHASLTAVSKATPIERMVSFINEINTKNVFIRRLNPQVTAMFKSLAPYCGFPMNVLFSNLWLFGGLLKKVMPKINAQAGGLIGSTCAFNSIEGSTESKRCSVTAMLRSVDEEDMFKDIEAIKEIANKYDVEVSVSDESEYHGPADMNEAAFAYTMDCIAKSFPKYPASPFILPAGTDARTLTDICKCVLRFAPIELSAQQLASVHSENE